MKSNRNFIVLEGICCSGKTTLAKRLLGELSNYSTFYNHGAMTYSKLGREFYEKVENLDVPISALYYYADLICDS